jgi:hypothetical protein
MQRIWKAISPTLLLALLPLAARAQDPDEAPQPLDPHAKAIQLWTYGLMLLGIVLAAGWYWLRRWQITHSQQDGKERDTRLE